ncbi:DUF6879 family protein [Streptomyces sp. NPDC085466]|uniref:DUF6879 family protein n=1 Tax=Streptomyces sp. NPDC085466 TaxID=3365725 RepID=UPI0037D7A7F2
MPERPLGDLFDGVRREILRLETQDDHSRSVNVDAFRRFLGGEPMPDDTTPTGSTRSGAGDGFSILDVTDQGNPLENTGDFWPFGSTTAAPMRYTGDGRFADAEALPDADGSTYTACGNTALAHAVPFADWWAEHAE